MTIAVGRAYVLAQAAKSAIVDYYDSEGIDLPSRRVVLPGLPAADCAMLGIHIVRQYAHDGNLLSEVVPSGRGTAAAFYMRGAQIAVYLVRKIPIPSTKNGRVHLPSVASEESAAATITADPQHMWAALQAAHTAGDLPGCGALAWESWESVTPQGALGGGTLSFLVSLE